MTPHSSPWLLEGASLLHKGDSLCCVLPYQLNTAWRQLDQGSGCDVVVGWRALLCHSVRFVLSFAASCLPLQFSCLDGVIDGGFNCVQVWLPFVFLAIDLLPVSFCS
jgi:hypothetical protein